MNKAEKKQQARSLAARKAALARWAKAKDRPLSLRAQKQQLSLIPTGQLAIADYADRPNPELSWAAAILKRERSGPRQREEAARIMSEYGSKESGAKIREFWRNLSPEERYEIAARGGRRRWEIWREERDALRKDTSNGAIEDSLDG